MCSITKMAPLSEIPIYIWERARLVLLCFLWFLLKRLTLNTFRCSVLILIHTETRHSKRSRWRKAFLRAFLFHQFMCQLDTVTLPPDNVHVGERRKKNELGSLRQRARNEKNRGVCCWKIAQMYKMSFCFNTAALEPPPHSFFLFSLRSIILHRCCLDFKSLLPIYLLLPLLE